MVEGIKGEQAPGQWFPCWPETGDIYVATGCGGQGEGC